MGEEEQRTTASSSNCEHATAFDDFDNDDSHVEKKLDPILVPEMTMKHEEVAENTDDDDHYEPMDGTKERKSILKQDGKSSSEGAIIMKKKPSVTKRIKKSLSLKKLKKSLSSNISSSSNKKLDYNPASSSSFIRRQSK